MARPQECIDTSEDYWNLPDGQRAKVREYWIVNPMRSMVQTYIFDGEENADLFSFDDEIAVQIFDGLEIRFSDLLK